MKIAVDVMGTDYGPKELVKGAVDAVRAYGCEVVLVGDENIIKEQLVLNKADKDSKISICNASEVIAMDEHPAIAVRRKKDASIVVASNLLRQKKCDALVSSGSTGAAVTSALFCVGRLPGVDKPCIATTIPSMKGATILLDSGAVVDAKPEHMTINAIMGSCYAEKLFNKPQPRVGLLNIGEEETKGNAQALALYPILKELKQINFIGNVEGKEMFAGNCDVVVCDGFVGNVMLKASEGISEMIQGTMGKAAMAFGEDTAKRLLGAFKKFSTSSPQYSAAPLLGVNGISLVCHGKSKAPIIASAIKLADDCAKSGYVNLITEKLAKAE